MPRILIIGYNPPQLMGTMKIEAAHYRTWQFLHPLLDAGLTVGLCAGARGETVDGALIPPEWNSLQYYPIPFGERGWRDALQHAHDTFAPDCVVAVNFSHCLYATKLRTDAPIWMDIYGDMVTIMQASCYRAGSDRGLETTIGFMREVLQAGDVFSVCGDPQRHVLVGELAMSGRLNHRTFGYEFTRVIRPGSPPRQTPRPQGRRCERQLLEPHGIQQEDFVVLWCGGYNTWTDVETLFNGLEWAMSEVPALHYVSVGANTYDAPDNAYTRLLYMIERSEYRDRFHMLGWRPWSEVAGYYRESDVGINIDALHYETLYGTRTRLVEMIAEGLPVITTYGAELSYLLSEQRAALGFEVGNWREFGKQMVTLARDRRRRDEMAEHAFRYARTDLSFCTTTIPLQAWVRDPHQAPDCTPLSLSERLKRAEHRARALLRHMLWRAAGIDR